MAEDSVGSTQVDPTQGKLKIGGEPMMNGALRVLTEAGLPDAALLRAAGVEARNGKLYVTRMVKGAGEVTESSEIELQPFVSTPAHVSVRYGVTINLGDYESARIEVGLSMPCYPQEVDQTFVDVVRRVGERIEAERREVEVEVKRRKEAP